MATTDIFNRTPISKISTRKAEDVSINITMGGDAGPAGPLTGTEGLFVQGFQYNYTQGVSRMYDLGDPKRMLYVAARPQGSMSLDYVIASGAVLQTTILQMADPCTSQGRNITTKLNDTASTCPDGDVSTGTLVFNNCLLTSLGASQSIQTYVISSQVQIMFSHLEYAA